MIFLSHGCFEISMISKRRTAVQQGFVFRKFTICVFAYDVLMDGTWHFR